MISDEHTCTTKQVNRVNSRMYCYSLCVNLIQTMLFIVFREQLKILFWFLVVRAYAIYDIDGDLNHTTPN